MAPLVSECYNHVAPWYTPSKSCAATLVWLRIAIIINKEKALDPLVPDGSDNPTGTRKCSATIELYKNPAWPNTPSKILKPNRSSNNPVETPAVAPSPVDASNISLVDNTRIANLAPA